MIRSSDQFILKLAHTICRVLAKMYTKKWLLHLDEGIELKTK